MSDHPVLAIVGATGAVGREFLTILEEREVPGRSLRLLASARSAGDRVAYGPSTLLVDELGPSSFDGVDIALFSAGAETARRFAPVAAEAGATVIDNSSAFRMDPDVPLVIPEVNGDILVARAGGSPDGEASPGHSLIANPNCSAIILVTALDPLRRAFGIERLVVSTYQAASGAGAAAMRELEDQSRSVLAGEPAAPSVFREPCAFNVFSHDTTVDAATGRNVEEQKVMDEARKIWSDPALRISVTCIRVPVMRAHAESVNVTLGRPATEAAARQAFAEAPGVTVVDDRDANDFPTSLKASGRNEVLVGRIRGDASQPSEELDGDKRWRGFDLFVAGDQLRKGAALNALQIADRILDGSR